MKTIMLLALAALLAPAAFLVAHFTDRRAWPAAAWAALLLAGLIIGAHIAAAW